MILDFNNHCNRPPENPAPGPAYRQYFRQRLLAIAACLMLFSPGCIDQIDVEAPEDLVSAVVIQGTLVKGNPSVARVEINSLFNFTAESRRFVNVLDVRLLDETGQFLELPAVDLGIYVLEIPENHPDFRIETGASYRLRVTTRDGRTYESTPEVIPEVPAADKLSAEVIDKELRDQEGQPTTTKYVRFSIETPVSTSEQGDRAFLKWEAQKTYRVTDIIPDPTNTCYITSTAGRGLWLLDGNTLSTDRIEDFTVHEEVVGPLLAEGFYLTVFQQGLSEKAYRYWEEINELVERTGSIFEPPAGKVRSNFVNIDDPEDEAFGFFYGIAQDTVRLYISPEFAGNPAPLCPPAGDLYSQSGNCNYPRCCDCREYPGSTQVKPSFWVE